MIDEEQPADPRPIAQEAHSDGVANRPEWVLTTDARCSRARDSLRRITLKRVAEIVCRLCGRRIGVYEPIVAVGEEADRETSRAREPDLTRDDFLMHAACYAEWNEPIAGRR